MNKADEIIELGTYLHNKLVDVLEKDTPLNAGKYAKEHDGDIRGIAQIFAMTFVEIIGTFTEDDDIDSILRTMKQLASEAILTCKTLEN